MLRVAPDRVTAGWELNLMPTEAHILRACDFVTCGWKISPLDDRNHQRASRLAECPILRPAPHPLPQRSLAACQREMLSRNVAIHHSGPASV